MRRWILCFAFGAIVSSGPHGAADRPPLPSHPLTFEANRGQTDERVKFLARAGGATVFLTATEAVLLLRRSSGAAAVRMRFVGADPNASVSGFYPQPGLSHYLIGSKRLTDVPHFGRVKCEGIYPGTDLVYYGNGRQLEYDLIVAPGADPAAITIVFEGAERARLEAQGNLILSVAGGEIEQSAPVLYQEIDGKRVAVEGRYLALAEGRFGFETGPYDRSRPLVIDPVLNTSTFLGGAGNDECHSIAVDGSGNHYVTGRTTSVLFPTTVGAFDTASNGGFDVFVTKLNTTLSTPLVYSTYIGGSADDEGYDIALDASNRAYVAGWTSSANFPTQVPFDGVSNGSRDAFVLRLNAAGNGLDYSTYLGGTGDDEAYGIAVDGADNAYVTGSSNSAGFPTTAGVVQAGKSTGEDAFVTRLDAAGSAGGLVYSTFHGGNGSDVGRAIALDAAGNAYVTGYTLSSNLPTATPFQAGNGGGEDVFVVKFNTDATARLYSTYIGGSANDRGEGIAVDGSGSAYVTGSTSSANYDTTATSFDTTSNGGSDAFVTKLTAAGSALAYSTYLGGTADDFGYDIAVDASGNAVVTGSSASGNYPVMDPVQTSTGNPDVIVTRLNSAGSAMLFSTYLAGSGTDEGFGVAYGLGGEFCVAGVTGSGDFPVTAGAFDTTLSGTDGFVSCFGDATFSINDVSVSESAGTATFTVTLSRPSFQAVTVSYVTGDFTAVAPGDYAAIAPTTLTFSAGTTTMPIVVTLVNDATAEPNETYTVNLYGPSAGVGIADALGIGTILNDDGLFTPPPDV